MGRPLASLLLLVALSACSSGDVSTRLDPRASASSSPSASPSPSPSPFPTAVPEMATPEAVTQQIVASESAIRSASTPVDQLSTWGRIQQAAYRRLVFTPEWQPRVLGALPANLVEVAKLHVEAGSELRKLAKPVDKLPSWKIVAPPPAEELRSYYEESERTFGIAWQYLAAIHLVESRMGRIRGTSSAGAQGPMQFLPSTWERYGQGGDINSPKDSILAAGRYLKAAGAPADMARALYAYNHSDRYVRAVTIYAQQMIQDPRTYLGYYNWQVYVRTTSGDVLLEVGYGA